MKQFPQIKPLYGISNKNIPRGHKTCNLNTNLSNSVKQEFWENQFLNGDLDALQSRVSRKKKCKAVQQLWSVSGSLK